MPRKALALKLLAFALAVLCGFQPAVVVAQTAQPVQVDSTPAEEAATAKTAEDYFMSAEHRQKIYEQKRKKPGRAALLSLALPGLGNLYAEQFLLAGLAFIFLAFTAVFLAYGLATSQPRIMTTGIVLGVGTYGVALVTSLVGVGSYNRELRMGLKVDEISSGTEGVPSFWTPAVTIRF